MTPHHARCRAATLLSALATNASLTELHLVGCRADGPAAGAAGGSAAASALALALSRNTSLRVLNLSRSNIGAGGGAAGITPALAAWIAGVGGCQQALRVLFLDECSLGDECATVMQGICMCSRAFTLTAAAAAVLRSGEFVG